MAAESVDGVHPVTANVDLSDDPVRAEILKLMAETTKSNARFAGDYRWWQPFVVVGGLLVGLAAIVSGTAALLHLLGNL